MNLHWIKRMKRWAQNPPGPGRVRLVLAVVGFCIVVFTIERLFGWPAALTSDGRLPRLR